jgi:hypothetical protein
MKLTFGYVFIHVDYLYAYFVAALVCKTPLFDHLLFVDTL